MEIITEVPGIVPSHADAPRVINSSAGIQALKFRIGESRDEEE